MSDNIKLEMVVNALKKKIGSPSALRNIFTHERVRAGQQVIDKAKDDYFDSIQDIVAVFQTALTGEATPRQVYDAAKSLKAQSEGLGFIFLMEVSESLYKFLQAKVDVSAATIEPEFSKEELLVVRKHAEALVAAFEKRERGKGGIVESSILNGLELLNRKYSKPDS